MKTAFFILLIFLLAACDGVPSKIDSNPLHLPPEGFVADAVKGKVLFAQNCMKCHGAGGQGSDQGPPFVHKMYKPGRHADLAFHLAVKNGVRSHHWKFGDMKPLPEVSPESVGHITAYVREIQRSAGIE